VDIACAGKTSVIYFCTYVSAKRLHSYLLQINSPLVDSKFLHTVLKLSVLFGVYAGVIFFFLI
jgi:hypothetical protein